MGSPFHPREYPQRTVSVAEFELVQVPVTVSQYREFLDDDGHQENRWWSPDGWSWLQGETFGWGRENRSRPDRWRIQLRRLHHPVVGVTWFEAQAYCAWLSAETKQIVRLPTEQEWEWAARGEDSRPFPWGESFDPTITNTLESNLRDTVTAGSLAADVSPFGVLEMGGNVQEWVASEYVPVAGESFALGPLRVARGGSFNDTIYGARTSYRRAYPPGYYYPFLGFRLVIGYR
jgi:formylglycine-generating enzyme required for sulfatase activity